MNKDKKRLLQYLGIIFISVILTYKLPHDSYSMIQYIIQPIKYNGGAIYLSGIVPLVIFIIGIKGLFKLERFAEKNKVLLFIVVVIIIIPIMKWTLDFTRTNYHWLKGDELRAVDIEESDVSLNGSNDELTMSISLKLIDYSRSQNEFKIRMYFPETLRDYVEKEFFEFENYYSTHGNRSILNIGEQIVVRLDNDYAQRQLFGSKWYWEDIEYELYNSKEEVKIIEHGL